MVEAEPPKLLSPSDVGDLSRRYRIQPSKALGQNFVIDQNTIRRIVRLAEIAPTDRVIEVGAGVGTLTLGLAAAAQKVWAIEIDRKLLPALEEVLEGVENVEIVSGDALELDYPKLTGGGPVRMVANLPYNIATPLIATLLAEQPNIQDYVIMVQREAAERFVAPPGSRIYGAVSVLVAYFCATKVLGKVPAGVFWPVPKVESMLVRLTRRPAPVEVSAQDLMVVVRAAFGQRRKTIRNSLAAGLDLPPAEVEAKIRRASIDPEARAESLSLNQFACLAEEFR